MTGANDPLRVIVVSVSPEVLVREFGLADEVDVVGSASGAEELADQVAATAASVATVDMALPGSAATGAIRQIASADPPIGIVALAAEPLDQQLLSQALEAGAHACATPRTIAEHGSAPFAAAAEGHTFISAGELRKLLAGADPRTDTTSTQRQRRFRNLAIGLTGGVTVAVVELLWRQYLGQIGVRPEELDIDAVRRITDVIFSISVLIGLIGPQFFVATWLKLIIAGSNDRVAEWLRRHRRASRGVLAVLTFALTLALVLLAPLLFMLVAGPFVGSLLLAEILDLDDDLPAVLRVSRASPGPAIAASAVIVVLFLSAVSYDVMIRGPEFDERGEVGWLAPSVLGFNAEPVQVTDVENGVVTEMLYLGSNGDIYVLVDPCDGDRVDYVSAGATQLSVIERADCD